MKSKEEGTRSNLRDSGEFRIVSCVWLGGHTYRITTESKRYGRVTQDVLIFPESALDSERRPDIQKESLVEGSS
jgi:hypothetical protein